MDEVRFYRVVMNVSDVTVGGVKMGATVSCRINLLINYSQCTYFRMFRMNLTETIQYGFIYTKPGMSWILKCKIK